MHPRQKVGKERYQEVMVALSESVMKNRLKRPLAEKSAWRPLRLAMKPRYLGNHASQMKSYYGTLWGSHGRSFRSRPEKLPCGEITMTSYLVGNNTLLSRKQGFPRWKATEKWNKEAMVALSESVKKTRLKRPLVEKSRWLHICLAIEPRYLGNHASQIKVIIEHYQ